MASFKNDALVERSIEGSVNFYSNHRQQCTASQKGIIDRLGGNGNDPNYNLLGETRRRFERGKDFMPDAMRHPARPDRDHDKSEQRQERQLAQTQHMGNFAAFQQTVTQPPPEGSTTSTTRGTPTREKSFARRSPANRTGTRGGGSL